MSVFELAVLIIAIALVFDYINGFHDAANSIATIVATRVLTPLQAVFWAAFFNFAAAFIFGTAVAKHGGQRLRRSQPGDPAGDSLRHRGRDFLGSAHVVAGAADQFVARA